MQEGCDLYNAARIAGLEHSIVQGVNKSKATTRKREMTSGMSQGGLTAATCNSILQGILTE
jgi:hypothetical protein